MTMTSELRSLPKERSGAAWLGAAAGLVGLVGIMTGEVSFSVTDNLPIETMIKKLNEASSGLLLTGGVQALAAMTLVLFGASVRRTLERREPEGTLTANIAWGGALLAAAAALIGSAFTQLASGFEGAVDPAIPLAIHAIEESLFAGAWCSVALIAGAVAFAGLKRGSVPRWFGGVSAFVAILLVVAQIAVPWAGWFPACAWLILSAFALRD